MAAPNPAGGGAFGGGGPFDGGAASGGGDPFDDEQGASLAGNTYRMRSPAHAAAAALAKAGHASSSKSSSQWASSFGGGVE